MAPDIDIHAEEIQGSIPSENDNPGKSQNVRASL